MMTQTTTPQTLCRHCRRPYRANSKFSRRGLCRPCYYTPAVRALCPSAHDRYAHVGVGIGGYDLAAEPTKALSGTPEKVAVLEERARLGVRLWHPRDARRLTE
jgi:hypothetical protein